MCVWYVFTNWTGKQLQGKFDRCWGDQAIHQRDSFSENSSSHLMGGQSPPSWAKRVLQLMRRCLLYPSLAFGIVSEDELALKIPAIGQVVHPDPANRGETIYRRLVADWINLKVQATGSTQMGVKYSPAAWSLPIGKL